MSGRKNYTSSRLLCLSNEMQLYDTNDSADFLSETELLKFFNKTWTMESENVFYIKGRKDLNCANINNTLGRFVEGFGSCSLLTSCICQFSQFNRKFKSLLIHFSLKFTVLITAFFGFHYS